MPDARDPHDNDLIGAAREEFERRAAHRLEVVLQPVSALRLCGLLQLAVRHPGVTEENRRVAGVFIEHVRTFFAEAPAILELIRRGDDPDHDSWA